ncbi:MAG: hypothetical protein RIC30_09375 [Marinoscillum sp.]|uniref:hypothetical protein n=1 Tax=Marinoscillum sp. TaxID=2024838 RepID=UPI0032F54989
MLKRLITKLINWLERLTYEPLTVDNANKKLIVPVRGIMIEGRQLYRYKNDLDIPIKRKVAISGAHKWFGASISVDKVVEFLNQILAANNDHDASRVGLLAYGLKDMITTCTDDEALYRMGGVMYFFKDEDHAQFDNDILLEKVRAFKQLPDHQRDFFFSTLLKHMGVSNDTSTKAILSNLSKSKVKLMAYRQLLSEGLSRKNSTD